MHRALLAAALLLAVPVATAQNDVCFMFCEAQTEPEPVDLSPVAWAVGSVLLVGVVAAIAAAAGSNERRGQQQQQQVVVVTRERP